MAYWLQKAPRSAPFFYKALYWHTFAGQLSTKWGLLTDKCAREGCFRHPKSGCPITLFSTQNSAHFKRRTSGSHMRANYLQKWGLLTAKSARKWESFSPPEVWPPHDVTQHPKFCALGGTGGAQPPAESVARWLQKVPREGAR